MPSISNEIDRLMTSSPHESEGFPLFKGLLQDCVLQPHW